MSGITWIHLFIAFPFCFHQSVWATGIIILLHQIALNGKAVAVAVSQCAPRQVSHQRWFLWPFINPPHTVTHWAEEHHASCQSGYILCQTETIMELSTSGLSSWGFTACLKLQKKTDASYPSLILGIATGVTLELRSWLGELLLHWWRADLWASNSEKVLLLKQCCHRFRRCSVNDDETWNIRIS